MNNKERGEVAQKCIEQKEGEKRKFSITQYNYLVSVMIYVELFMGKKPN